VEASVKLGRIRGIPIGLHWSWFLVFVLVTSSLAGGYFVAEYPDLSRTAYWILGAITSLLFFGSVLAHEFGHALVALRDRVPVRSINLFFFGGVAQIEQEPRSAASELRIAIAGPLVSLSLAGLFGLLYWLDQGVSYLAAPSLWLARINLGLALFNLIPGFPLDGGRIFRALVWAWTKNFGRATRIAAAAGQVIAYGFIAFGAFTALTGNVINGLWLAFIGWFLQNAASSVLSQARMEHLLGETPVARVMSQDYGRISSTASLDELVEDWLRRGGASAYFVIDDNRLVGMVSAGEVSAVPRSDWMFTRVAQIMTPAWRLLVVQPENDLLAALRSMERAGVTMVPVVSGEVLAGALSREQALRYLRLHPQAGI
jgi:Zn-dependent protease/CBS domain-containing protein